MIVMKRNNLIAYAQAFSSFILDSENGDRIRGIILFGSVARNEFDEESDIDMFIDTDVDRKKILKQLNLFSESQSNKTWKLKGIKNEISIHVGDFDKSPLKRDIISSGIQLYGSVLSLPAEMSHYLLFTLEFADIERKKQVNIWRKLYGYTQKVGKKIYKSEGLINSLGGKKLEKGIFIIHIDKKQEIIKFLNNNKIKYKVYEIWSDVL